MADERILFHDPEHAVLYLEIQKIKEMHWKLRAAMSSSIMAAVLAVVAFVRSF